MDKEYNRIVLIGNGFDLAAGLNTSYKCFINAYIKKAVLDLFNTNSFESDLLSIKMNLVRFTNKSDYYKNNIESKGSASDVLNYIKDFSTINYKFDFIKEIIQELQNERWVDIEQLYYNKLKSIYDNYYKI
jgi:hypothetical protein